MAPEPRFADFLPRIPRRIAEMGLFFANRRLGLGPSELKLTNKEGSADFACTLPKKGKTPGVTAMLRVKNERTKMAPCLHAILPLFDEVVVIDNGSTDETIEITETIAREHPDGAKIVLKRYPHSIARCGDEHDACPADSIHNLAYYYNWCYSHCTRTMVCKWDADMVLTAEGYRQLGELFDRIRNGAGGTNGYGIMGQTIYRDPAGRFWGARDEINVETRFFPNGYVNRFFKGNSFEILRCCPKVERVPSLTFYELKFADEDEFSHWDLPEDQEPNFPTERKKREWQNYTAIKQGKTEGFDDLGEGLLEKLIEAAN